MSLLMWIVQLLLLSTLCQSLVIKSSEDISFSYDNTKLNDEKNDVTTWVENNLLVDENYNVSALDPSILEDAHLNTYGLIHKYGYPAENHTVVTDDGYILTLHRIARPGATPVLLVHGLLDCSSTWVMMGPGKGLGYLLYEQGYDVWMINVRGNTYSRGHIKYSQSHAKYWDFTFHEMGVHDIPSSIDYILKKTYFSQLHYIGHSQGTVVFWIMGSERPEYMKKIIAMQAMAPVAYMNHCKSPVVNIISKFQKSLNFVLKMVGVNEFLPNNAFIHLFKHLINDVTPITKNILSNIFFLATGFDKSQLNETMWPVILGHNPAGASTKQILHFGQIKRSGQFRRFDYGCLKNFWHYKSLTPPPYKLENVKAKVALYYADNDWLAQPTDAKILSSQLPNVVSQYLVDYPQFNHLDFIWGVDARKLVWDRMLKNMNFIDKEYFTNNLTD